jgi:hypothetical protein
MWGFLTAGQNLPFTVALAVMALIGIVEMIGLMIGGGVSSIIENALPDSDVGFETPDLDGHDTLAALLSWLRVGEVPILVLLVIFLTAFGAIGLVIQGVSHDLIGMLWPGWLISIPAFLLALPSMRWAGGMMGKVMPRDETSAVSQDSLVGRVATITLGTASNGSAAQAKVKDAFRQDHYVMVEPDNEGEAFPQGKQVLLVRRAGAVYFAIGEVNTSLLD